MVTFIRSFIPFVLTTLLSAAAAGAQAPIPTPSLRGTLIDPSGARIPSATLVIQAEGSALSRVAEVSPKGAFEVAGLPSGPYLLTVAAPGFAPLTQRVELPLASSLDITLAPAAVIEEVRVVSASRQEELRETLNTRVDVVSRARIEDSGAQTVGEVLREIPGVMTRRGSEGAGAAGHQIQGIDSKQVLVLLDGVPLVGARGIKRGGAINLDRLATERLERVEVIKGAASALYGSDAIGGVISLITRDAASPLQTRALLSGGSRGDLNAVAEAGTRQDRWSGLFVIERHQSDGFDLTPSTADTTSAPFRRHDVFAKVRWTPTPQVAVSGLGTGYRNRAGGVSLGELGAQYDDVRERTSNGVVSVDWNPRGTFGLQARGAVTTFDERANAKLVASGAAVEPGEVTERLARGEISVSQLIGSAQQLQGGVEYLDDRYTGRNRLRNDAGERASTAVAWAQHRLALGSRVTTTAGVRVDSHSQFGEAVSPKIGVSARVAEVLQLRASLGRGFRAPDVGQLYYRFLNPTNIYQVIGNPNLTPERATSLQFGADVRRADRRVRAGVSVFRNDVRDLIESHTLGFVATPAQLQAALAREGLDSSYRPVLGRLLLTYKNVADAVTRGVEVDAEAALSQTVSVAGAYTYLDARDNLSGRELTGRHRHHGHLRGTWLLPSIGLRANVRATLFSSWIATRTTSTGAVVDTRAPAFALIDTYVSKTLGDRLSAFLAIDNVADDQDPNTGVMAGSAPAPIFRPEVGRTIRFGARWSWSQR